MRFKMDVKEAIIRRTRPFQDRVEVLVENQSTSDIIQAIIQAHKEDRRDYDRICEMFASSSAEDTGWRIWKFLKKNVPYKVETEEFQTVRTPGALMSTADELGADCKNYSLFTGGIIDALNRQGAGIDWCYRFASYKWYEKKPYHVFVVLYPGTTDEIWVDAVQPAFDYKQYPAHYKDKKMVAKISGIGAIGLSPLSRGWGRMGDPEDDSGLDDYTYEGVEDPNSGDASDLADQSSGFDLSTSSGAGIATQASPDLGSGITDPSSGATALTPDQAGNFAYNSATGQYEAVNPDGTLLTDPNVTVPSTGNIFSNILSALTGGSAGSGGGSGGSGGGLSSGSSSQQKQNPTTTGSGSTVNVNVPSSSSSNTTLYIVLGAAALIGVVLLMRKK